MKLKKAVYIMAALVLALVLAACGADGEEKAVNEFRELMKQEQDILSQNSALWEKVFMAADKGMTMQEDGKNYGDFLLKTIDSTKDQFTADELSLLQKEAEKVRDIENKLIALEEKYPAAAQKALDSAMGMPADGSMQTFPAFEGKDLDGNDVKSSELFSGNAVTVVNFWFTTCSPCVSELDELEALNGELAEKGGELIGINSFTLDGGEKEVAEAKDVLSKAGATYRNVYFASDGEAGRLTTSVYAYPTTYVVDRNGNIVGQPIVGAITSKKQLASLWELINEVIDKDAGMYAYRLRLPVQRQALRIGEVIGAEGNHAVPGIHLADMASHEPFKVEVISVLKHHS